MAHDNMKSRFAIVSPWKREEVPVSAKSAFFVGLMMLGSACFCHAAQDDRTPRLSYVDRLEGTETVSNVIVEVPFIPGFVCRIQCYEDGFGGGT